MDVNERVDAAREALRAAEEAVRLAKATLREAENAAKTARKAEKAPSGWGYWPRHAADPAEDTRVLVPGRGLTRLGLHGAG